MILVTGGTGLVGAHLLLELLKKGKEVRAIHRDNSDLDRVQKVFGYYGSDAKALYPKIQWSVADLNDIPALELAFEGVEFVYHAAAFISFDPGNYKKLKKTNSEGTANIVNLCIAKGIKKLAYVSSIATLGKSVSNKVVDEENAWSPQEANVYALTKYAAEMEVWRATQEGVDVVIVNPGVIIGPGFWNSGSGTFFQVAKKNHRFYPPGGTGFVSVNDVVSVLYRLMESPIKNERYILVAENLTFFEILKKLSLAMNLKAPKKELKYWQLKIGLFFDWLLHLLFRKGRKITRNSIRSLKNQELYDNEKIKKALQMEFEPIDVTIAFSCERFLEENP